MVKNSITSNVNDVSGTIVFLIDGDNLKIQNIQIENLNKLDPSHVIIGTNMDFKVAK